MHRFCQSMVAISAAVTVHELHTPFVGEHRHSISRDERICRHLSRPDLCPTRLASREGVQRSWMGQETRQRMG